MVVVADAISNRMVVAAVPSEGQALVAGDDAAFTVDPRDQYDNRLDSQDQQVLNQVNLVVDTFRVDPDLGNPKMLGLQVYIYVYIYIASLHVATRRRANKSPPLNVPPSLL